MAGLGSRFKKSGYKKIKYMLPVRRDGTSMIEMAITTLNIRVPCKYFFVLNRSQEDVDQVVTELQDICYRHKLIYNICWVDSLTEGAASTVYSIIDQLDKSAPLLVSNSDQILDNFDCDAFLENGRQETECAGNLLTFTPDYELTIGRTDKHSFLRLDDKGNVCEVREKEVLSNHALVGVHWFRCAGIFMEAYEYMVRSNLRAPNGEFYLSLCYQAMLEMGKTVTYTSLDDAIHRGRYFCVGDPVSYNWYRAQTRGGEGEDNIWW
jgi:dTDP-glucose pyrophosphorylase